MSMGPAVIDEMGTRNWYLFLCVISVKVSRLWLRSTRVSPSDRWSTLEFWMVSDSPGTPWTAGSDPGRRMS